MRSKFFFSFSFHFLLDPRSNRSEFAKCRHRTSSKRRHRRRHRTSSKRHRTRSKRSAVNLTLSPRSYRPYPLHATSSLAVVTTVITLAIAIRNVLYGAACTAVNMDTLNPIVLANGRVDVHFFLNLLLVRRLYRFTCCPTHKYVANSPTVNPYRPGGPNTGTCIFCVCIRRSVSIVSRTCGTVSIF